MMIKCAFDCVCCVICSVNSFMMSFRVWNFNFLLWKW